MKPAKHYLVIECNTDLNVSTAIESWGTKNAAKKSAKKHNERMNNLATSIPIEIWDAVIGNNDVGTDVNKIYELFQNSVYKTITKEQIEDMLFYEEYYLVKDYMLYLVEPVQFMG